MYDFSLDKKTLIFVTVCCLTVGGLLFFAGIIVGLDRGSRETQARMEKEFSARLAAGAKAATSSAPQETAESRPGDPGTTALEPLESASATSMESTLVAGPAHQPQLLTVAGTSRSPLSSRLRSPVAVESRPAAAEESGAPGEEQASDEEEADAASEPANDFSLQIGAFRSQENAARLRDDLKARGYAVFLLRTVDARGTEWHTVRMGHYHDMAEASSKAADFSGETQMVAVVRAANQ
ncbi:MAG TPA: SPOR domain-containing protein [Candidatus Saccharimonadales bacterium]|jgi:cell division septation protein DedD|nr:SPOR domain-containing protein [Candidatus Saccharimonadales bacterium]